MFHLDGVTGRMASGSIEQLRQATPVSGIARARRVAPVGTLAGLAGRAALLPPGLPGSALADAAAWDALLAQPVSAVRWTPVPAAAPETELRRVAELLRAIVADPSLDLWG